MSTLTVPLVPFPAVHTLPELLTVYEQEYLPRLAPNTQRQKRGLMPALRHEFGALPLDQLTPARIGHWRDALRQRLLPGSVHQYLHIFSSILTIAVVDLEWLPSNPMKRVRKPPLGPERVRFLDAEEQARLLAACSASPNPRLYPLVLLALTTGLRRNEAVTLQWTDVDFARGQVRLMVTKTRLRRAVPMPQMTVCALERWLEASPLLSPFVFPSENGMKPAALMGAWYRARRTAQLEDFRFHDLRHTAASYLAMSGVRLEDIAEILGHKKLETTRRYRHLAPAYTAELVERMAQQFITEH